MKPVHVKELVAKTPHIIGECDACGYGLGGVWLLGPGITNPIVWRLELPDDITCRLVSSTNRKGGISISELEMAAHLLHFIVLEYCVSLKFESVGIFSDNTPTVDWASKLSSKSLLVGRLLRALAIRQYVAQSSLVVTAHIKSSRNIRADNASRWFDNRHNKHDDKLSHLAFLPFFNSTHKLQQVSWVEFRVSSALSLKMTNELRGKPSTLASWIKTPPRGGNIGGVGCNTPATWVSALIYKDKAMTQLLHCSASQQGSDQEPMEKAKELAFRASQTRWAPSQRLSKWEDTIVPHTDIIKHPSSPLNV